MKKITIRNYLDIALSFFGLAFTYHTRQYGTLRELFYKIAELRADGKITAEYTSAVFAFGSSFAIFMIIIICLIGLCIHYLIKDRPFRALGYLIGSLLFVLIPINRITVFLGALSVVTLYTLSRINKPIRIEKKVTPAPIGTAKQNVALKYIKKGDKLPHSFLEEHPNGFLVKRYYVMAADGSSYAKDYNIEWNEDGIVTRADVIEHKSY
jgi:hypothetical protein